MRIAVATNEESVEASINPHFGRAPYFLIFDAEGHLLEVVRNDAPGDAHGVGRRTARLLIDAAVTHVIAGRFGSKAEAELGEAGIEIFGHAGQAIDAVRELFRPVIPE